MDNTEIIAIIQTGCPGSLNQTRGMKTRKKGEDKSDFCLVKGSPLSENISMGRPQADSMDRLHRQLGWCVGF